MLQEALEEVARRIEDPWYLALLGPDGIAIESLQYPPAAEMDPEMVCVEAASLLRALAQSHEEFEDGSGVAGLSVSLGKVRVELSRFEEDVYLLAVSASATHPARLRYEVRRASQQLSQLFD